MNQPVLDMSRHHTGDVLTQGVHHLALNTDDMKATIDFYQNVMGMPLVHAMKVPPGLGTGSANRGNPPYEEIRHYFFDMGNNGMLAFFEIPKGKEPKGGRHDIGGMQHCAFVVTASRFRDIEQRLKANGVTYTGPLPQLPGLQGIYFYDPNGIRLEFASQAEHGENPDVIGCVVQSREEIQAELKTLDGADEAWLESISAHLPE